MEERVISFGHLFIPSAVLFRSASWNAGGWADPCATREGVKAGI
jgi:hypothetical protein